MLREFDALPADELQDGLTLNRKVQYLFPSLMSAETKAVPYTCNIGGDFDVGMNMKCGPLPSLAPWQKVQRHTAILSNIAYFSKMEQMCDFFCSSFFVGRYNDT